MNDLRLAAYLRGHCFFLLCVSILITPNISSAQTNRRVATLSALDTHSVFFHGEEVVLVVDAEAEEVLTWLVDENIRVLALDLPTLAYEDNTERLEIIGTFYDVGRLEDSDPRLQDLPIKRISERLLNKVWPAIGELPIIVVSSSQPASKTNVATLRNIALGPRQFDLHGVTITGRFRGKNLYGDMPEAPEESRWDFVLRSADASVWVVGIEPKGDNFSLDVLARVDTNRWLEVTGRVRVKENMTLIEAGSLKLAEPGLVVDPKDKQTPLLSTPPEVIFSAPLLDDINVPRNTTVRIQFSHDMDADSFEGNIRISYAGEEAPTSPISLIDFEVTYRGRNRVVEIRLANDLDRFRSVQVDLLDSIKSNDGNSLVPWSLTFITGN